MNIVFLDCTQNYGYQFSAANTKVELMARGLKGKGATVTIVNGISGMRGMERRTEKKSDLTGNIITYPDKGRYLGFLRNKGDLRHDLEALYKVGDKNIVVLSNVYLYLYNLYMNMAHSCGFKVVAVAHEWLPTIKRRLWIQNKMGRMYADTFGKKVEGILPISEYIIERIRHFGKPYLKIPVLADFSVRPDQFTVHNGGLVYCVYAAYSRVIDFILQAYAIYVGKSTNPMRLTLVLSGPAEAISIVHDKVKTLGLDSNARILTKLPYGDLISLYNSAQGLIIPLDPDHEQDHARFSQKIAEYLSSGSPIVTNNVGEITHYFTPSVDAIVCDYTAKGFAEAFQWIETHPSETYEIGHRGFELGRKEFNYQTVGERLYRFLEKL